MQDKVGQEFDGTVSGITEWGMYVEIEPTKIEGMVSLREIKSDFFFFDEPRYRLVGRRTHKIFRLGDKVRIKVTNANLEQRLLDYELVEDLAGETAGDGNPVDGDEFRGENPVREHSGRPRSGSGRGRKSKSAGSRPGKTSSRKKK